MLKNKRRRSEKPNYFTPQKKQTTTNNNIFLITKENKSDKGQKFNIQSIIAKKINEFGSKNKITVKKNLSIELNHSNPFTIKELHSLALEAFNSIKNDKNITYKIILEKVIDIYDLDENINEFFLKELYNYYKINKIQIDKSKDGISNSISNLFFNYIYTLGPDKRKAIFDKFYYFQKDELFLIDDKKFFYKDSLELIFKKFINELLKISLSIEKNPETKEEYGIKLNDLYSKYQFPSFSLKIPLKYGNVELLYIEFILRLQTIFSVNDDNESENKFFNKYDIMDRFLALNYFKDFFSLKTNDILSIQYILFCLFVFFRYYKNEKYLIKNVINEEFMLCSRFVYQSLEEKKRYLKEIAQYIINEINFENINEKYLEKNLLTIKYNNKKVILNANNCFFLGKEERYLEDLVNNRNYSFEYLKKKKFPLFFDNEKLNDDFNSYIKTILQSNLTLEYIKSLNIKNIKYLNSVFTEKIIKEINENKIWIRFPINNVYGITDRDLYTIYLNSNFETKEEKKKPNIFSSKIIACAHEDSNHVLRLILSINYKDFPKTTQKLSESKISKNIPSKVENKIFRLKKYNKISHICDDQGDMWEYIIFGNKVRDIFIMGGLFILNEENFKLNIEKFKKEFIKYNQHYSIKEINEMIKKGKKNAKNTLFKYINKFSENTKDEWLIYDQIIVRRQIGKISDSFQCSEFGICGTHAFDK